MSETDDVVLPFADEFAIIDRRVYWDGDGEPYLAHLDCPYAADGDDHYWLDYIEHDLSMTKLIDSMETHMRELHAP